MQEINLFCKHTGLTCLQTHHLSGHLIFNHAIKLGLQPSLVRKSFKNFFSNEPAPQYALERILMRTEDISRKPHLGDDNNFYFKITPCGDPQVGKTGIIKVCSELAATENSVMPNTIANLVDSNRAISINLRYDPQNDKTKADIADQLHHAHTIFLVYDITNAASYDHVLDWYEHEITQYAPQANVILVGTKADHNDHRKVSYEKAKILAENYNWLHFEVSIHDSSAMKHLLQAAAHQLIYQALFTAQPIDDAPRNDLSYSQGK